VLAGIEWHVSLADKKLILAGASPLLVRGGGAVLGHLQDVYMNAIVLFVFAHIAGIPSIAGRDRQIPPESVLIEGSGIVDGNFFADFQRGILPDSHVSAEKSDSTLGGRFRLCNMAKARNG
jgi:hypothetical protein